MLVRLGGDRPQGEERSVLEIGVDVGGTFTDFTFFDHDAGRLWVKKVSSTPEDVAQGVLNGLAEEDLERVQSILHGTTVAINAVLQAKGAKTAILTTAGFQDHIEIGDTLRYTGGLFDHKWVRTRPPVPHSLRFTVNERTAPDGRIDIPVSEEELEKILERLKEENVESLAVCFLNSYVNDRNEMEAAAFFAERLPGLHISASSVNPEFREYPRFITAVFNAYITPMIAGYIQRLGDGLAEAGYAGDVLYMTSAGGILGEKAIVQEPLRLLFGAVAGGVSAGAHIAQLTDSPNLATFDMGGTSTDVGFVDDFRTQVTPSKVLQAFPIALPHLDVRSIGAGGGSIASLAPDGALKVGPESAGATPGPACYGRGGRDFTVTDANLLLGRLGTEALLGGDVALDLDAAQRSAKELAKNVGISDIYELAAGVLDICNTNMYGAIREVSIERGEDPQDLALVAFGGAGGLHAIPLAERLSMPKVLVPRNAGIFSALGLLLADRRLDFVRNFNTPLGLADVEEMVRHLQKMESEGRDALLEEGIEPENIGITYRIGMRYQGQVYEEEVILEKLDFDLKEIGERFGALYEEKYKFRREPEASEIVNLRVVAVGKTKKPDLRQQRLDEEDQKIQRKGEEKTTRKVFFGDEFVDCPVLDRNYLKPGQQLDGPTIIEEYDSTIAVFPSWKANVDEYSNLVLTRSF